MTDELKLLPCPFCGGPAVWSPGNYRYRPTCEHCGATTRDENTWNERAHHPDTAELERLLEIERMRVVACMTVASANTRESAVKAREMHDDYKCAAVNDVAAAVDREMELREQLERLRAAVRSMVADRLDPDVNGEIDYSADRLESLGKQDHADALRRCVELKK